jgi:CheY-like chemotaxis protein
MAYEHDGAGLRVVLVDDRPDRRRLVRQIVVSTGLELTDTADADDGASAIALIEAQGADVAIVEIQMPIREGLAAITALRSRFSRLRIVVCSFHVDPATKQLALDAGADAYLDKPVRSEQLREAMIATSGLPLQAR